MTACASGATFGWRPVATRIATLPATRRPKAFPRERFRTKAMRKTSAEGFCTEMGHFGPSTRDLRAPRRGANM
jgi:hypothetical protein